MATTYAAQYNPQTGAFLGVLRSDGASIPQAAGNADWQAFLKWNGAQPTPITFGAGPKTARVRRSLYAIYADLQKLTAAQQAAIQGDLFVGSPWKVLLDAGPNAAAIAVLYFLSQTTTLSAADKTTAELYACSMYTQDYPNYLIGLGINVAGDQPA